MEGPLSRGSEQSLGQGLERPLQNKMGRIGLELLGHQLKEGQGKEQETRAWLVKMTQKNGEDMFNFKLFWTHIPTPIGQNLSKVGYTLRVVLCGYWEKWTAFWDSEAWGRLGAPQEQKCLDRVPTGMKSPGMGRSLVDDVGRGLKVISVTQILSSNIICPIINYCDAHLGWRYFKLFLPLEMSAWIILESPCNLLKKYVILELEQSNILCQFIHLV